MEPAKTDGDEARETKQLRFDLTVLKDLSAAEDGTIQGEFEGLASVFGNVDLGKDVIHAGAFRKTIAENSGRFHLLYRHETPVGVAYVEETPRGLATRGILNLDKEVARDIYSDLKFYKEHSLPMGMSIGYRPEKVEDEGDIRNLREVKLLEVTLTPFPMNTQALVSAVKEGRPLGAKEVADLREMLGIDDKEGRAMNATRLGHAKRAQSAMTSMMTMLDDHMNSEQAMEMDAMATMAGHGRRAQTSLQALLDGAAGTSKEAGSTTSDEAAASTTAGAATPIQPEPPAPPPDVLAEITTRFKELYSHARN